MIYAIHGNDVFTKYFSSESGSQNFREIKAFSIDLQWRFHETFLKLKKITLTHFGKKFRESNGFTKAQGY